jgi:hypothetical protein
MCRIAGDQKTKIMDVYEQIEQHFAQAYGAKTTTRKAVGDFMLNENHAVNVKSNNVNKANYSPNMTSIKVLHQWVFEEKKQLSFIFVDYEQTSSGFNILKKTDLVPVHHISWDCLSIEAQGYGVVQKCKPLKLDTSQSLRGFYEGMMREYQRFRAKEAKKHEKFSAKFITDLTSLDEMNDALSESAPRADQ